MKWEWRKKEQSLYLPKQQPVRVEIPSMQFLCLSGEGSPDSPEFTAAIQALYSVSYAIKMGLKKEAYSPKGYLDYTVYPLEGTWDITEAKKKDFDGSFDKKDLVYTLMIRQPTFIPTDYIIAKIKETNIRKQLPLLESLKVQTLVEGPCIQMLHVGPFATEAETFAIMESLAKAKGLTRKHESHREIYLSDFRKVPKEKLKTVLRFQVE